MFKRNIKHLHRIRVSVFFLYVFCVFGCSEKKEIVNNEEEIIILKQQLPKISFSKRVYKSKKITTQAHCFSSNIGFKEAKIYSDKEDNYTFAWIVDGKYTDLEELQKWKLGMILKPKNRSDFEDLELEKKGIKTIGVLTKPYLLNDEICILLQNFTFKPKDIAYVKFYLYNDTENPNLKYWITKNVSLKLQ